MNITKVTREVDRFVTKQIHIKIFCWNQIQTGECYMQDGSTLTLYSDGHAKFEAIVSTYQIHEGNTWVHSISVTNCNGIELFKSPRMVGPKYRNDVPPVSKYEFGPVYFNFDPDQFNLIENATVYSIC